jgi:DNA-binding NtrC family response regulator
MRVPEKEILLVTREDLLHDRILESAGYVVTKAKNISEARLMWQPARFALVLIAILTHTKDVEEFCEELKNLYPPQPVALLTGWYTFVPQNSCPDEAIPRSGNPETFVARVTELLASA